MTSDKRAASWIIALLSLMVIGAGAALSVHTDTGPVERTVALSSMSPWQATLDGRAGRLYVTGFGTSGNGGRTVSVVDTTTGRLIAAAAADSSPEVQPLLDARTHHLFLFGDNGGAVLDTTSERVAATVPVGVNAGVAALDATDNHLFVADRVNDRVSMIDTQSMALLKTTPVGHAPEVVAVDETTRRVFAFNALDATISVLDARDGRVLHTTRIARVAGGGAPTISGGLTVDEATARVFIVDSNGGVANGAVVGAARVGQAPGALVIDDRHGRAIVVNTLSNSVSILDAATGRVLHTTHVGKIPHALALDRQTRHAFVVNYGDGTVSVLDDVTGALIRTDHAAISPEAVAVDERTGRAFVIANGNGYGVVTVLDTRSGAILRSIRVGERPDAIVVDAQAGRALIMSRYSVNDPASDRWNWLPGWLRQRLPWLTPRPTPTGVPTSSIRILDAAR